MDSIPPTPWLEHLALHLPLARQGDDPEGVHQVRVALGRLDTWLRAAEMRILRDDLRWLRRAGSRVRDLDVQLAADPPAPFAEALCAARDVARTEWLEHVDAPRTAAMLDALRSLPPLAAARIDAYTDAAARKVARRGKALAAHPTDLARYHALRRAVRRLRYALEWAGRSARPVKDLQDALGELNDAVVTLELLTELCAADDDATLVAFRAHLAARVEALRAAAFDAWSSRQHPE